jgi:hypothetical protein
MCTINFGDIYKRRCKRIFVLAIAIKTTHKVISLVNKERAILTSWGSGTKKNSDRQEPIAINIINK